MDGLRGQGYGLDKGAILSGYKKQLGQIFSEGTSIQDRIFLESDTRNSG